MASEAQVKWIRDMLVSKDLLKIDNVFDMVNAMDAEEYAGFIRHWVEQITTETTSMKRASSLIEVLKPLPYRTDALPGLPIHERAQANVQQMEALKAKAGPPQDIVRGRTRVDYEEFTGDDGKARKLGKIILPDGREVLAGSYGVDTSDDDRFTNNFSFFKVWIGDRGGWSVQLYVSDDTHRVKLAFPTQLDALRKIIDAGLEQASRAFGLEFGRCGVCGRGLTNDESRELGIGPVCRARVGR